VEGVKVQSIESLKLLRAALVRFGETAQTVLSDADGELQRVLNWIETEAVSRWQTEIHKRQDVLTKAKDALRAKKLFHADGFKPSVVDEEKAVRLATLRLEEAERKLDAVRRYAIVLHKEVMQYRGQVQRFGNTVAIDVPIAVGRLEALVRHLEAYMGVKPAETAAEMAGAGRPGFGGEAVAEDWGSMARPTEGVTEKERKREGEEEGHGGTGGQGGKETSGDGDSIRDPQSEIRNTGEEGSHGRL